MNIPAILISLLFLMTLSACEKNAEITSPKKYNKQGISFNYPSNWEITEDTINDDVQLLIIETVGDALFIIQTYKEADAPPLNEFSAWFSEQATVELPIGKMTSNSFTPVEKTTTSGKMIGLKEKLSIKLLGQGLPYIREYYSIKQSNKVAFLISQFVVEDQSYVEPGFDLIFHSFLIQQTESPK